MKQLLLSIITICFWNASNAQDSIFFRNNTVIEAVVTEINPAQIKYRTVSNSLESEKIISRNSVFKIKYKGGSEDVFAFVEEPKPIALIDFDSLPIRKNAFRIYLTDVFFNKLSVGYERRLSKKFSLDLDAFYKFPMHATEYFSDWLTVLQQYSEGGEFKVGVSRHFYTKKSRFSYGAAISYRQQIFLDATLSAVSTKYYPDKGIYNVSQTKKGFGFFLKFNLQFNRKRSGIEFFITPGIYASTTKNEYHWYRDYQGIGSTFTTNPDEIPKLKTKYMKDGFAYLPYINFGFDYVIKQPQKGWYKKLVHKRDSLKFKRKNIILYNPIELTDGALGFTYLRIFYKPALSVSASAAIPLKNHTANFSNGILTEGSRNYALNNKTMDFSVGANYNFMVRQQSFPFIGVLFRGAQFDGYYGQSNFILNKYYAYVNTGFVVRAGKGFTFLMNLAFGHYYNNYITNNPEALMEKNHFIQPADRTVNSFGFSMQFGYSF